MRALVQGLPLREAWDRYLRVEGSASEPNVVRATIQWIRDAFAAAARREHRFGTARLVLIDVSQLSDASAPLPSLEEFAAERGLEDFSQDEQLEAYEAEFGKATQRTSRRARVIARQLEALRWLEQLVAQPPRPGDPVASWFAPAIADRLESAGIATLAQLIEHINAMGRGWTSSIRGVGAAKAQRVRQWLVEQERFLGLSIAAHAGLARAARPRQELERLVAPATDIRPLEKFLIPASLDGRAGAFRLPQIHCRLRASDDREAILAFLQSRNGPDPARAERTQRRRTRRKATDPGDWVADLSHTQRAYRKEAERFLLWAVLNRGKALSSIDPGDCRAYVAFLADPQPRSRWCGPRGRERWSPLWRPFEGPLEAASQGRAVAILRSMYAFWCENGYVFANPWIAAGLPVANQSRLDPARSFTPAQWTFARRKASECALTSIGERLLFALTFLYATGLRLSEAVAATTDDLRRIDYPPEEAGRTASGWELVVPGRGGRRRDLPLAHAVLSALSRYLASRGLDPDPMAAGNKGAFLLGKAADIGERARTLARGTVFDPKDGIAENTLYHQLKRFFAECASELKAAGQEQDAGLFQRASTHWLRHTHAAHSISRGTPIHVQRDILGHASVSTTAVYASAQEKQLRMRAMNLLLSPEESS
jgi:site-specific recombinase XerD